MASLHLYIARDKNCNFSVETTLTIVVPNAGWTSDKREIDQTTSSRDDVGKHWTFTVSLKHGKYHVMNYTMIECIVQFVENTTAGAMHCCNYHMKYLVLAVL